VLPFQQKREETIVTQVFRTVNPSISDGEFTESWLQRFSSEAGEADSLLGMTSSWTAAFLFVFPRRGGALDWRFSHAARSGSSRVGAVLVQGCFSAALVIRFKIEAVKICEARKQ
jgi:hypothetical protein